MPGWIEVWSAVLARPLRLLVQAAALTGVVVGSVGFTALDRSIDLVVDGHRSTVHAYGGDVSDVLRDQGLTVGQRDVVAPAPETEVGDDTTIVVRFARRLTVVHDGETKHYWTTALSVDEALRALGIRADAARLSVSRSMPLGRQGLSLTLTSPKHVLLRVDGRMIDATTYAATVGDFLREVQVTTGAKDRLSVPPQTLVTDGLRLVVSRVVTKTVTTTEPVPFETTETKDDSIAKGDKKVKTPGVLGQKKITWVETWVDGRRTSRVALRTVVTKKPVAQEVLVGTKTDAPAADGLNWGALADCESGGNPRAVNPAGYYGLYQFDLQTWRSVGGSGNPTDASSGEQTMRAQKLYARVGRGAWPNCGRYL